MRHWDTEKSWSPSFRERVANRREYDRYRIPSIGFAIERREHLTGGQS